LLATGKALSGGKFFDAICPLVEEADEGHDAFGRDRGYVAELVDLTIGECGFPLLSVETNAIRDAKAEAEHEDGQPAQSARVGKSRHR